jgi:hypothetical protein
VVLGSNRTLATTNKNLLALTQAPYLLGAKRKGRINKNFRNSKISGTQKFQELKPNVKNSYPVTRNSGHPHTSKQSDDYAISPRT